VARRLEGSWRTGGDDQAGKDAVAFYRAASQDPREPAACDAALRGALLSGDTARDAATTHASLLRVRKELASAGDGGAGSFAQYLSCRAAVEGTLALLTAFGSVESLTGPAEGGAAQTAVAATGPGVTNAPRAPPWVPPSMTAVESWTGRDAARVVIVLDRPAAYRVGDEAGESRGKPRVFLDFDGVAGRSSRLDVPADGIVTGGGSEPTTTGSRVWIDLDGHAWRHVFEMQDPYRIVVDVARQPPWLGAGAPRSVSRIVLDPGHGGSDHGASGPTGIEEKDVVLDIARRVAPVLSAQGIETILTRSEDRFVSLEERTARANAFGADLFVSIHCNASESRAPRGIETYVLDTSRDEIASRLAARENATTEFASAELASILRGLRVADGARRSNRLAQLLLRTSTTALRTTYGDAIDGGVHAAGFYVLVGARMPAVLFETSYISNPVDELRLATGDYRQLFADAIANAVRAYREGR
jgi:N-acetylmuramoyl-L-alanine amidase